MTVCPGVPLENLQKKVKVILLQQQTTVSKQNLSYDVYCEEDKAGTGFLGVPWSPRFLLLLKAVPTEEGFVPSGLLGPSAWQINVGWTELGPIPPLTSKQALFCRCWGPPHTACVDSHASYLKKSSLKLRFIS